MTSPFQHSRGSHLASPLFLPLAFRFGLAFGLLVLQLALPTDPLRPPVGEELYLALLLGLFGEASWEIARSLKRAGQPFSPPSPSWIRLNVLLDILLVAILIAYQGVDQERFATIYIFPVLVSAFYLHTQEILAVGVLSATGHVVSVLLFTSGILPPFGHSDVGIDIQPARQIFILGFATIQIFLATTVVLLIRKHLESLRIHLSQSEATVDELSALYRRVFESMFSGLITTSMEGDVTSANPAAESILQRRLELGTPLRDLGFLHLEFQEHITKEHRFEWNFTTGHGEQRTLGGNLAPLRDAEGLQTGHLLLFQDLTELKALEEKTRINEKLAAVGELSSALAHELRNPVASILGCAQILQQGETSRAMTDRVVTILKRESERVSALVSNFLDFTRPKPAQIRPLWLPTLMDEVHASWETNVRKTEVVLEMDPPPPCWIQGDPLCVHQIFTNLLSNACKALKGASSPQMAIRFSLEPSHIRAVVEDQGCGMSPEQLKSVFVPFSSGFQEGTGLGMSLVFQFIQQMGWDIQVDSTEGSGTQVQMSIPRAPAPPVS